MFLILEYSKVESTRQLILNILLIFDFILLFVLARKTYIHFFGKKKKKNKNNKLFTRKGIIVSVLVLILLFLCLIGFDFYYFLISNEIKQDLCWSNWNGLGYNCGDKYNSFSTTIFISQIFMRIIIGFYLLFLTKVVGFNKNAKVYKKIFYISIILFIILNIFISYIYSTL